MRPPQTDAGQEWLSEATERLAELRDAVGEERVVALRRSARALHKLLYVEPAYAANVQQLALSSVCLIKTIEPELALRFGDVGLRAGLLVPDPTDADAIRSALLDVNTAEASILARRFSDAESTLDALDRRSRTRAPIWRYTEAASACLRGRIHEEGLERERASRAYESALDVVAPLLSRAAQRKRVVSAWLEAVTGVADDDQVEAATALVLGDTLAAAYVWALLGRGRMARGAPDGLPLLRRTLKAVSAYGLPKGVRVEQLAATVGLVADRLGLEKAFTFSDSLTDDALEAAQLSPDHARPVLEAAIAHAAASADDALSAGMLYQSALRAAVDTHSLPTMACVLGRFVGDMIHAPDQDDDLLEALLRDLTVWGFSAVSVAEKAEFEDALSTLAEYALALWNERGTPGDRMRLGVLLDVLKRPEWVPLPSRWDLDGNTDLRSISGLWFAMDWLGRLQPTLQGHPDTGVIAIRAGRNKIVYLCASGGTGELLSEVAWVGDDDATGKLAAAARDELDFVLLSGASGTGELEALCRAAFDELPHRVRAFIAEHDVLVVVPDERTDGESAAFELLHDGDAHLGTKKVVSRVPSLRALVHLLESGGRLLLRRRALVAAAPAPEGLPPLLHAAGEAEHVRADLEGDGWDVPAIDAERLGPEFLLDRLQHVAIAHIAAHGVSTAGDEALLLPAGQRLTTEFLRQRRPARLPFVYLNSCFLGTTSYLGGGARRGLAHALIELGAPAVVASLNPVDDRLAAVASAAFYEEAREHPVGEAVRRVRARLAERGVAAPMWGTVILLGDPHLRLFDATAGAERSDRAEELLDSFASAEPEHWNLDRYPAGVVDALEDEADEPRLRAAAFLVHSLATAEDLADPRAELHFAVELADQLDHAPSRALVRLKEAFRLLALGYDADAVAALDKALPVLDALNEVDPGWAELRTQVYGIWLRKERALNGEGETVLEIDGTEEEVEFRLNEMLGSQAIAERRGGDVRFRIPEETVDDVAWNAVRIGHPWPGGTFRERCELAALLAAKLARRGFVPATPLATTLVTGILDHLWKGLAPLDYETMRRSTALLVRALADFGSLSSSLPRESWADEVAAFAADVRTSAADAGTIPARTRQKVLREQRLVLNDAWQTLAERLARESPEALGACSAFAIGSILEAHAEAPDEDPLRTEVLSHLKAVLTLVGGWTDHADLLASYDVERPADDVDELERWRREEGLVGAATRVRTEG